MKHHLISTFTESFRTLFIRVLRLNKNKKQKHNEYQYNTRHYIKH